MASSTTRHPRSRSFTSNRQAQEPGEVDVESQAASASDEPNNQDKDDKEENDHTTAPTSGAKDQQLPSLGKLISLGRPEYPMLVVAVFVMVAVEGISLLNPILVGHAYDALVDTTKTPGNNIDESSPLDTIHRIMPLVIGLHAASVVGGWFRSAVMAAAGERVVARVRQQLYTTLLRQDLTFFDQQQSGALVSRLGTDTTMLQTGICLALPEAVAGTAKTVTTLVLLVYLSTELAAVMFSVVTLMLLVCLPTGRWMGQLAAAHQDVLADAQAAATEVLASMRTVKSCVAENQEAARYQSKIGNPDGPSNWWWCLGGSTSRDQTETTTSNRTTYSIGVTKAIVNTGFWNFSFGVGYGSLFLSLWYGFTLVTKGRLTLGELTAFQALVYQIGASFSQTSHFFTMLLAAQGASGRIFDLLERRPATPPQMSSSSNNTEDAASCAASKSEGTLKSDRSPSKHGSTEEDGDSTTPSSCKISQTPHLLTGLVVFHRVGFSYPSRPDKPVLVDFSVRLPPNTTTALVGPSGVGKSTCISLLQRFYEVTSGSITVDGIDIRLLDVHWFRSHIGYVQQEPQLFGTTIRENIIYGTRRPVSRQELDEVSRKANAYDFIHQWPDGYDTIVGERGIKLSGGQKQRIAIARGTFLKVLHKV